MKKIDLRPQVKSALFLAFTVTALATSFTIEFFTANPKLVELTIESVDKSTGDFSGEAMSQAGEVWEVAGTLVDNKVEIEFNNVTNSKRILAAGKIDKDGVILGRAATEEGELFEWETTDALMKTSNS
ncbi:hypothetical protein A2803_04475 [Candidatus Woesebacteria bacterium RIFCSPHIGHO2_01_FULL_44_21]|uniref:Uncharacterized protein n=1 Tax=Candidatus Woesebacteria bacterium RIFCSPHIGHO2_01_FULL_44_21 TaxID=1802503 RepID=A0A1F7YWD4_9BACT|nr:MAG: hypothetical protein A2803_04475 [Candidatus Woesebacteria bacterium RIFCSPHIGHO2_01_FULL_44_21]OGM71327.1 MAG: hypothetical protein A2897_00840 [Candidatus Woesebacteria bacterium RIFCSPLOWO2_01_FULL_44_24b]